VPEHPDGRSSTLVEYLVWLGYQVALLNPLQAAQFRRSQGKRADSTASKTYSQCRTKVCSGHQAVPVMVNPLEKATSCFRLETEILLRVEWS
jgi:transposase